MSLLAVLLFCLGILDFPAAFTVDTTVTVLTSGKPFSISFLYKTFALNIWRSSGVKKLTCIFLILPSVNNAFAVIFVFFLDFVVAVIWY